MLIDLDIELIFDRSTASPLLLSIGYGNGHVVAQIDAESVIDDILTFITCHRAGKAACWMEVGRFASCSVTFTLSRDLISIVIGTEVSVRSFGQSAGIHIPKDQLDKFVVALKNAQTKIKQQQAGGNQL